VIELHLVGLELVAAVQTRLALALENQLFKLAQSTSNRWTLVLQVRLERHVAKPSLFAF
jgi:hypothetical protein